MSTIKDNIPWRLYSIKNMLKIKRHFSDTWPSFQKYAIASELLLTSLGAEWFRKNIGWLDGHNTFLMRPDEVDRRVNLFHQMRVIQLGDVLYTLRNSEGFLRWAERLREKDLQAAFCEAYAAKFLRLGGHEVEFFPRTGKKGRDFDFCTHYRGLQFAVEVKSKGSGDYPRFNTVYNSLNEAVKSLPKDNRCVVFLFIPEDWIKYTLFNHIMEIATTRLLRGSKQINYIILVWFQTVPAFPDGIGQLTAYRIYRNYNPRLADNLESIVGQPQLNPDPAFWRELYTDEGAAG